MESQEKNDQQLLLEENPEDTKLAYTHAIVDDICSRIEKGTVKSAKQVERICYEATDDEDPLGNVNQFSVVDYDDLINLIKERHGELWA